MLRASLRDGIINLPNCPDQLEQLETYVIVSLNTYRGGVGTLVMARFRRVSHASHLGKMLGAALPLMDEEVNSLTEAKPRASTSPSWIFSLRAMPSNSIFHYHGCDGNIGL